MSEELNDFKPFPLFQDPHSQTIMSSLFSSRLSPRSYTQYIKLPDQDQLTCEISEPDAWDGAQPTIVLIHGLCGSTKSCHLIRLAKRFYRKGFRSVRVNLRGCGSSRNCRRFYHSGSSDDVLAIVQQLKNESPDSPLFLIGFSLGGSIALKLAGELKERGGELLAGLIAVSPPIDLYSSIELFSRGENAFYEQYFYKCLRAHFYHRYRKHKDLPKVRFPLQMSLYDLDEQYIAPTVGFASAMEYYEASSAKRYIPDIQVRSRLLFAEDDPLIDTSTLRYVPFPENVSTHIVRGGGHLGFLQAPEKGKRGVRWMDHAIERWIDEDLSRDLDYPEAI